MPASWGSTSAGVSEVILSHHHGDHTGGLVTLRRELSGQHPKALSRAYVGDGIFLSRPGAQGDETNETLASKKEYEALGGSFVGSSAGRRRSSPAPG